MPFRIGGWLYYQRTEKGKQYAIWCRKSAPRGNEPEGPEQVILDVNELAKGEKFMSIGPYAISDDGNLLAYSTDNTGFRQFVLRVKDLKTGTTFPESVPKTTSVAWAADNRTLFYTVEDSAKRPYRLFRHRLGEDVGKDPLLYEEKDERFRVFTARSRSRAYVWLGCGSHTSSELRFLPAASPDGSFTLVAPREKDREYDVQDRDGVFWIRTNDAGRNFRLVTAPASAPGRENWKEVLPVRPNVMLEDVLIFKGFWVAVEREDALVRFRVTTFGGGTARSVSFPEPVYSAGPQDNREFDTPAFRYRYQSFVTPVSISRLRRDVGDVDAPQGDGRSPGTTGRSTAPSASGPPRRTGRRSPSRWSGKRRPGEIHPPRRSRTGPSRCS